jgi:glycosidase
MIKLRKKHRALRDGEFKVLFAEGMTVAYARRRDGEHAVVVLNASDHPADIVIHTNGEIPDGMTLKSVLGHRTSAKASGGVLSAVTVPARDGIVLMHQD